MAIIENMWLRKSKKRLGGVVLYQAMEQTRARELASSVANPRTASQMGQRVKWSQLVNFYRSNSRWMKYAFETKKSNQSEYNRFMQLNVGSSNVYFTKDQAAAGASIVLPYIMTQGSLPSIEYQEEAGAWWTNIYYPTGAAVNAQTTVAEFSQNLISVNPAIRQGDQLSFIRFTQMFNSDTGIPYVIVRTYEIVLDIASSGLVGSYLPLDYIGIQTVGTSPSLVVIDSYNAGGFLMCLSRTQGGKTFVSSQSIITTRMADTISSFSSNAQLAAAVESYGESADAFLSSTTADTNTQAPTPLSIIGFQVGARIFRPGSVVKLYGLVTGGDSVSVLFNSDISPEVVNFCALGSNEKPITLSSLSQDGAILSGTISSQTAIAEDEYLSYITVRTAHNAFNVVFSAPLDPNNSED